MAHARCQRPETVGGGGRNQKTLQVFPEITSCTWSIFSNHTTFVTSKTQTTSHLLCSKFCRENGAVFPKTVSFKNKGMVSFKIELFLTSHFHLKVFWNPAKPKLISFCAKRELKQCQKTNADQDINFSGKQEKRRHGDANRSGVCGGRWGRSCPPLLFNIQLARVGRKQPFDLPYVQKP